ncbi:uncharacterized protein CCOS01_04047 [Colletotrichum costaricense]|uniref:Uncharacterized protein n=1 Tax=Colletotrichum costaricense TaxID=1209916 RepID=A0AAI9Z215_9PEZI|nr:uncharacterized protein CCOS01_04047 [Colletotrichum costaricense]KAK1532064.1 hypothetical protein CCOS01_04047 [Colletotrichum costaricense]
MQVSLALPTTRSWSPAPFLVRLRSRSRTKPPYLARHARLVDLTDSVYLRQRLLVTFSFSPPVFSTSEKTRPFPGLSLHPTQSEILSLSSPIRRHSWAVVQPGSRSTHVTVAVAVAAATRTLFSSHLTTRWVVSFLPAAHHTHAAPTARPSQQSVQQLFRALSWILRPVPCRPALAWSAGLVRALWFGLAWSVDYP